ncbi:NERD domain-containing protein [Bacillus sp. FJAT-29790]|uniref:nuclease-related domain-containing protein n=1 Tax=Bacillus sp. FJAT-29790 TaxID=1895002 RepID=UPI001C233E1A|nr:nuclease-related domain-containing protein [Bacillus sp. FJAT-29790]MBU8880911.1 NERD domain-containing protein [Bacillus sp. FJAT-29790]
MIAKERLIPLRMLKNEALLRRIPKHHVKRTIIEKDQTRRKAGYRGEEASDYYVNQLPDKEYTIFHDLRLLNEQNYFQMDTLILSPKFALILEIKNISGTIYFDSSFKHFFNLSATPQIFKGDCHK